MTRELEVFQVAPPPTATARWVVFLLLLALMQVLA